MTSRKIARVGAALLRRVSDEIEKSDTRRLFIPRGTLLELDLNRVMVAGFRYLARGLDGKRTRKAPKTGKGSRRGGRS